MEELKHLKLCLGVCPWADSFISVGLSDLTEEGNFTHLSGHKKDPVRQLTGCHGAHPLSPHLILLWLLEPQPSFFFWVLQTSVRWSMGQKPPEAEELDSPIWAM